MFWAVPVIALLAVIAALVINQAESSRANLPILCQVPPFTLTERSGNPLTVGDLKGRIQIVDFIFTNCPGVCPVMTANMAELYRLYASSDKVHFLSISVDPDRDSLAVLRRYATDHGVTDKRWLFARGPLTDIAQLLEKGFLLAADDLPTGHPSRFILVDDNGRIRGYYSGDDQESLSALKTHVRVLARAMP